MGNDDVNAFIDNHIKYIRQMSLLDDNALRALLKIKIAEDSTILEKFKDVQMKKQLDSLKLMAKDVGTNPVKIARRVDGGIKF